MKVACTGVRKKKIRKKVCFLDGLMATKECLLQDS